MIRADTFFFLLFALVACGGSVAMVLARDVVRMATYLILALSGTAVLFFLAGAEFVGAVQLMVYVGGTLVLLVFGLMLTGAGGFSHLESGGGEWVAGLAVGGLLFAAIVGPVAGSVSDWSPQAVPAVAATSSAVVTSASAPAATGPARSPATELGAALVGVRADRLGKTPAAAAGRSGYLLPFELISLYLLAVLIGSAYLARAKRRKAGA